MKIKMGKIKILSMIFSIIKKLNDTINKKMRKRIIIKIEYKNGILL